MKLTILMITFGFFTEILSGEPNKTPVAASDQKQKAFLTWTGTKGAVVRARFVKKEAENLVLELETGIQKSVPFSWFSPASLKQATDEAKKQGDQSIALLREMRFVPIKRGRFTMGSPPKELGRLSIAQPNANPPATTQEAPEDFEPERKVNLKADFWLKETEVTWTEWNIVRKIAPDFGYTDIGEGRNGYEGDESGSHPVTGITWLDAIKWCNAKSQIEGKVPAYYITPTLKPADILTTGNPAPYVKWEASGYRLPTEAEWEYVCREGRSSGGPAFHSGQISHPGVEPLDDALHKVGWYAGNSLGNTHPVKKKEPNSFKLHDMHGNVAEWCWDFEDWEGLVSPVETEDPRGPASGQYRIFRGGSWADPARCCRAAYRGALSPIAPASPMVGFRPACGSDPQNLKLASSGAPAKARGKPLKSSN